MCSDKGSFLPEYFVYFEKTDKIRAQIIRRMPKSIYSAFTDEYKLCQIIIAYSLFPCKSALPSFAVTGEKLIFRYIQDILTWIMLKRNEQMMKLIWDIMHGVLRKAPELNSRLKQALSERLIRLINRLG